MSYITGQAPKVYHGQADLDAKEALSDERAVRMLLNDNTDAAFPTGSSATFTVNNSLNLVTSSNKSLTVIEGVLVEGDNVFVSDMENGGTLTFDPEPSTITYRETLQYKLEVPHNGRYRLEIYGANHPSHSDEQLSLLGFDHPVEIKHNVNYQDDQDEVNVNNSFRHLSDANEYQNSIMGVSQSTSSMYGQEGELFMLVPDTTNVVDGANIYTLNNSLPISNAYAPNGTLAASGISHTQNLPTGPHTVAPEDFAAYRISHDDAKIQVTQSYVDNNVAYIDADEETAYGGSLNTGDLSFSTYVQAANDAAALAYSGNMTSADFNALNSSTVIIRSIPTKGDKPFQARASGYNVSLGSNKPDLTGVGDQYPKTALKVTVNSTHNLTEDEVLNSDYLSVDLVAESIHEGSQNTDATVTFDSSDRATVTSSFGASVDVVYPDDPLSSSAPNGVLSDADMTTKVVSYSATMKVPSTTDATNAAVLSNKVVNNMAFIKDTGLNSHMTISEVDTASNNLVGKLIKATLISSDEKQDGVLLKINNTNDDIPDFDLDLTSNSFGGSDISGSINSSLTEEENLASHGIRVRFAKRDLFASSSLYQVLHNAMVDDVNDASLIRREDNVVVYDINQQYQGPMNLEHVPTSGLYAQKYQVKFPDTSLKGNAKNFQQIPLNPHPVPTHVVISSFYGPNEEELTNSTPSQGAAIITILLDKQSVKIVSTSNVDNIVTVEAEVLVPLRLPGVVDKVITANEADVTGTAALKIPLKYQYNNSTYTWVSGTPTRVICLELQAANVAYTHNMIPEGSQDALLHSPTSGTWVALCEESFPIDLRRGLDADNENASLNLLCNLNYNLNLKLDVRGDENAPSVYSVDYVLGTTYQIDQWTVQYALAEDNLIAFCETGTLNKNNIDLILQYANSNDELYYGYASSVQTEDADNINYITTVTVSYVNEAQMFKVAMANPKTSHVYFVRMTEALVMVNGVLHLLANDEDVKVADGITVDFSGIQGTATVGQQVLSMSLNVDKYSAIAYEGQDGSRVDYDVLRAIPDNKVLIPSGPEYAIEQEGDALGLYLERIDVKDADGVAQPIGSYGIQVEGNSLTFQPQAWILLGSPNGGRTWHILDERDLESGYVGGTTSGQWTDTVWYNTTSNQDCPMTNVRLVIRKWPYTGEKGSFPTGGDSTIVRPLANIAFSFSTSQNGANVFNTPDYTKSRAGVDTGYINHSSFIEPRIGNDGWKIQENLESLYLTHTLNCQSGIYNDINAWVEQPPGSGNYVNNSGFASCSYGTYTTSNTYAPPTNGTAVISTHWYIPCPLPATISGINSDRYRGFPDGVTYHFHRAQTEVVVEWGMEGTALGKGTETFTVASVPLLGYATSTFGEVDLGHSYGIKVYLSENRATEQIALFDPNIADIQILLNGVVKASGNAQSFVLPSTTEVPFVEKYQLDHFFVPSQHDVTIRYKLADYVVEKHHYIMSTVNDGTSIYAEAEGSEDWEEVVRKSDVQLLEDGVITLGRWNTLTFSSASLPHRIFAKKFFITVVPMLFEYYAHGLGVQVRSVYMLENTVTTIDSLSVKYNLKATIDLNHSSMSRVLSQTTKSQFLFIHRDPLLLSIRGVYEMPPLSSSPAWHTYIDQQPFTSLHYEFDQYNTGNSSRELLAMDFSSLEMHPIHGNWSNPTNPTQHTAENQNGHYVYSSNIILRGWVETELTQYVLKYELDADTKQVVPVVVKMVAQPFNPAILGPDGSGNIDGANGTKDTLAGGFFKQFPIVEASKVVLSSIAKKLGKPYNFLTATDYPAMGFGNSSTLSLPSLTFSPIDLEAAGAPEALDLLVNVRDFSCAEDGSVTYNTNGTDKYSELFNLPKYKRRVLSIFAKDQLVVKDHLGNLSTRVGPDGQFYTSDVLAYSVRLQSNQSGSINRLVNGPANSQVALSAPQELHIV